MVIVYRFNKIVIVDSGQRDCTGRIA